VVIINSGFGIDRSTIKRVESSGRQDWLYNTGDSVRVSAGLWLWRTDASRYVQWHGRMPTADPFDPLDGREADFQMLYPTREVCPAQSDINADLLRMAEGVVDQRWLLWLAQRTDPASQNLVRVILGRYSGAWNDVEHLTGADLDALRGRIIDLTGATN